MLAQIETEAALYRILFLVHILAIVVGFGSSFVWPVLGAQARKLGPGEGSLALARSSLKGSKLLSTYGIYAAAVSGILLVASAPNTWKFSQVWISAAFLLFIVGAVCGYLLYANSKAMVALQEKLVSGEAKGGSDGPPPQVAELQQRAKRAAMLGGIAHLMFLLLVIDMIWKPGIG